MTYSIYADGQLLYDRITKSQCDALSEALTKQGLTVRIETNLA